MTSEIRTAAIKIISFQRQWSTLLEKILNNKTITEAKWSYNKLVNRNDMNFFTYEKILFTVQPDLNKRQTVYQ